MSPGVTLLLESTGIGVVGLITQYFLYVRPAQQARKREAEAFAEQLQREAELRINAAILESKTEVLRTKERYDEELKTREASLTRLEERLASKDEALEARRASLTDRESLLHTELRSLSEHRSALERRAASIQDELQRIAKMTREAARDALMKSVEEEFREQAARRAEFVQRNLLADAERKARSVVLDVIQNRTVEYVSEATLSVLELPSEDMKGRIIGREGRNIRAFEQVTGVDLIIDDTPEAVVISCFDPLRREAARMTLTKLMTDGRIHPALIEEVHQASLAELERSVREAAERAAERAAVTNLTAATMDALGKLRYRTSYAQNVLDHSVEVSKLARGLAEELGLDAEIARRAGFLHDIGKALDGDWQGPHAITGMEFLKTQGESEPVLIAVGAHHHDIEPSTAEAILVIIADTISAARPGARRESLDQYVKRLTALEAIANSFPGIEKSYALQAGREVRLIVKPNEVDDLEAARLAKGVAQRIEGELDYPGQVKVTVIRETRHQEIAR